MQNTQPGRQHSLCIRKEILVDILDVDSHHELQSIHPRLAHAMNFESLCMPTIKNLNML